MAAGWTFATTIKDAAAEEFWAVLEKTELTPHINAFTLTGSGTKFRVLYRLDWADTDAPMLYLGLTADGQIWIFPGACPAAVCTRLPGAVSGRQRRLPGHDAGLFRHFGGTPRLIILVPRHRQAVAALIFRVAGVPFTHTNSTS